MDIARRILSDITIYSKYAKYIPAKKRRETWEEIVSRTLNMHLDNFKHLGDEFLTEIENAHSYILDKKVLPSMRFLQFAGLALEINPARGYNCSYGPVDHIDIFSEAMFLLLSGCGFSFSVQQHHVEQLPELIGPSKRKRKYLINDSIIGWADAVKQLIYAYFEGKSLPIFDYRDIRQKGALLITAGGKAPGPQPLKDCIHNIKKVLDAALEERGTGTPLTSLESHDIMCYIADSVMSGGIRRAACLSGFSYNDEEMLASKSNDWFDTRPERQRSNNSVVLLRRKLTKDSFDRIFNLIEMSRYGEPGIILSNDKDYLFNPCGEASLRPHSFCNLTTIVASDITTQEEFNNRARAAALLGTLQASYTDFHYLREIWKKNTEKDALLGVSMTGIASKSFLKLNFTEAAEIVKKENKKIAKLIGINKAARTTLAKPEGSTSCVVGSSSGVGAWHSLYYIRRLRVSKNEPLYSYLKKVIPALLEDDVSKPHLQSILSLPMKAPDDAITRTESAKDTINRCVKLTKEWILPGHISGANTHNVSATINVKDEEWPEVKQLVWDNIKVINGMTFYRYDGGDYPQRPFEECTEETYNTLLNLAKNIDITKIKEDQDDTTLFAEAACSGGSCTITNL